MSKTFKDLYYVSVDYCTKFIQKECNISTHFINKRFLLIIIHKYNKYKFD